MKRCNNCDRTLSEDQFGKNKSKKDGLQTQCKDCRKSTNNNHYQNSEKRREAIRRNAKKFSDKTKRFVDKVKAKGCCKCGEKEKCTLDFHHLKQNKDFEISKNKTRVSISKLKDEIRKCILVCSNCHRKIHAGIIDE